jgi:putative flavoprotein involved in K+ transport
VTADYDDAKKCWTATLRQRDGSARVMHPRHIVFCNGVSTIPKTPKLPGLDTFKGTVRHSGEAGSGLDWKGKRALVLGTGTSGHDVAQDLAVSGASVAIIQNGPTLIVSLKEAQSPYALYDEDIPFEDLDHLAISSPYPIYARSHQQIVKKNAEADRALLDGLKKRGFKLTSGPDGTGWQIMYQNRGGGYYFDAGCSQMIADGKIDLLQFEDIERFCEVGVRMQDGSVHEADLIVLATGYFGQKEAVRGIVGDAIADRIGPVWGFDDEGELAGMWRPTGQPGLWFFGGGLAQCRIFSKVLALQIKARELGIVQ